MFPPPHPLHNLSIGHVRRHNNRWLTISYPIRVSSPPSLIHPSIHPSTHYLIFFDTPQPIVYFMSGASLTEGGAHFGIFVAVLFTIGLVMGTFIRLLVYLTPNPVVTQGVQGK